ncbi:hypothetical protein LguiA_005602 [Lonicera macranthoides]
MEQTLDEEYGKSLAALTIFIIVMALQFLSKYLEHNKKRGSTNKADVQLRAEIKQLLKEASSLSQPSTFAQAAKLRRMAAAKEKELAKNQELHSKEKKLSHEKVLMILKVLTYFALILWFWRIPVAVITENLVQPLGKVLSWRTGGRLNDNIMVGVIPWLIVSNRVGKFICAKVLSSKRKLF